MKIKTLSLLLLALPCLALSGQCNDNPLCTGAAVAAVILKITDSLGNTIPYATTSFLLNSAGPFTGSCDGTCNSVILAYDASGKFEITVAAPGYVSAHQTVNVALDAAGCHSVTQNLTVVLPVDSTVGALNGAWYSDNAYGASTLRFGEQGQIIGAILYDRTVAGDHNFYFAYNGRQIRGAAGQQTWPDTAPEPTRNGNIFHFRANPVNSPIGFENATLSSDYMTLTGMLNGTAATWTRWKEIPTPLQDP